MKRSLLICLFILLSSFIFAQTFDVIKEYSFNDIPYYEDVIDDIPYYVKSIDTLVSNGAGISRVEIYKDKIVGINASKNTLFESSNIFNQLDLTVYPYTFLKRNNTLIVGTEKKFLLYIDSNNLLEPDYVLSIPGDSIKLAYSNKDSFYVVNNRVFATTEKNELIQWKLLGNGKTEFIDIENTKKELADGLQEQLGIHSNNNNVNYFFGENFISSVGFPNIENSLNNLKYFPEKYNFIKGLQGYHYLGTSNKGISIYYKYKKVGTIDTTKNPDTPITIMLAVVDPWTRNVNIVELPEGGINPPRNAEKGFIAFCSQCMDEDGNLYFTDVNKEKGVYQIKKVSNEWLNNYDFSNRKIGIVNSNHIELKQEPDLSSETIALNFEHEYLWILESNKKWSKVQKVSGVVGWIENKFINLN